MKPHSTPPRLAALLAAALSACGSSSLLVGDNPNAAGTSGNLGGAAGATGATVTGTGGSAGGPGTVTRQVKPLRITGTEAITRIAQVLWNDAPDADLMSQAAQGHFTSTSDLSGAIHQMLVDPRAAKGVGAFYVWWLDLANVATVQKDASLFPAYTPALQSDMAAETETFAVDVTLAQNGTFRLLLGSPSSFLNARLADLYGVSGVTGDNLRAVSLDPTQRQGLLTQPAILVQGTNLTANDPSMRGSFIIRKFLCNAVPPPPAGENSFPTPSPGLTVRQALTQTVSSSASCEACHTLIDPPGYAFENYDAIGRWRTTDNGGSVDTTGLQLTTFADPTPTVDGPLPLIQLLETSSIAQQCMVRQWYAYVSHARPQDIDPAVVDETYQIFRAADLNLKELIVAVLTGDGFLAPDNP